MSKPLNSSSIDFSADQLLNSVPAVIAVYEVGTGKYLYINSTIKKVLGYTPDEIIKGGYQFVAKLVHPDDLPRVLSENQKYVAAANKTKLGSVSHDPIVSFEYRIKHKDGRWVWVQTDGSVIARNAKGKVSHIMNISMDITERKLAETNLQEATKQFKAMNNFLKSQKTELMAISKSKDEFISLASHQLRTPATGVKQYLGILLDGYGGTLTDSQMKMLKTAYESNERQLQVVDDLLRVAHVDAGKVVLKKKVINLVELIEDVINEQRQSIEKRKQKVVFKPKSKEIKANVDVQRIRMVIENILDNASKYSHEGKTIRVELEKFKTNVQIRVIDEGVGISKKDLPKLFHKFSRVNNSLSALVGGTGIGLYWAQKIVHLHLGNITVESEPDRGTVFSITFPR